MSFRILFCALLATAMGQSVVITTLPSLGREAGLSEFQVAIIMSSSAFIFALGTTLWSRVAKRHGYRRILMIGLTGYSIGTFIFASVWWFGLHGTITGITLFLALLVSRSMQSSIMSATPPSTVGYAIAITPLNRRVNAISKVTSANNLGQVLGPTFAGALVSWGLLTPLYSIIGLTVLALWLVWKKLPAPVAIPSNEPPKLADTPDVPALRPHTLLLVSMCASLFCAMAMMQQSLGFFLIDHCQATTVGAAQGVGIAMMISAACSLFVQFSLVQRTALSPERLIHIAMPLLCCAYMLMYLHHGMLALYIAMGMLGLGMGLGYASIAAAATSRCAAERTAGVTGMITATPAMGYVLGPPVAALLYNQGHRYPFLASVILLAVFSCLALLRLRPQTLQSN